MGLTTFMSGRPDTHGLIRFALSDRAVIETLTTTSDSGGGATAAWATSGTVDCRIDPLSGGNSRMTGGVIDERSTHIVTTPADTEIDVRNRVTILGRGTFEVTAVRERTGQLTQVFEVLRLQ